MRIKPIDNVFILMLLCLLCFSIGYLIHYVPQEYVELGFRIFLCCMVGAWFVMGAVAFAIIRKSKKKNKMI